MKTLSSIKKKVYVIQDVKTSIATKTSIAIATTGRAGDFIITSLTKTLVTTLNTTKVSSRMSVPEKCVKIVTTTTIKTATTTLTFLERISKLKEIKY